MGERIEGNTQNEASISANILLKYEKINEKVRARNFPLDFFNVNTFVKSINRDLL